MSKSDEKPDSPQGSQRQFLPPFAELIDRLCVDQIKEVLISSQAAACADEMAKIAHDIDLLIQKQDIRLSARLIRMIVVIAQMNVHIWYNKDRMAEDPERYLALLKLSHQLNGLRNQVKNLLLEEAGDRDKSAQRTNFNTDGLEGWRISLLEQNG
jgi:hypothetical protein